MRYALVLSLCLVAGCASLGGSAPGSSKTFDASIARVKPALVSTLADMGMTISSLEVRGRREIIKARKAGQRVEVELERLGPAATRVRVAMEAGAEAIAGRIIRQTEKLLNGV